MSKLQQAIAAKHSFLCVGLDTDLNKIPAFLREQPDAILDFNRRIIDATKDVAVAYKINTAFYECMGIAGWQIMEETLAHIPIDIFTIADAKRGDIDNTSRMYARAFFETLNFDSITVAPYMGEDSVKPFLEYPEKTVFLLALTSNKGSQDFQWLQYDQKPLYQTVMEKSQIWAAGMPGKLGYVVGATQAEQLEQVRKLAPDACLLVPGVGAQGGDLETVCKQGASGKGGLLVNASRSILYKSGGRDFEEKAFQEAVEMVKVMRKYVK